MKRSTAASGNLVKKADASNGYRLWITSTGAVQFDVLLSGTTKTVTSATTIPLNTWKHVAARYDGSELRVFIGGTIDTATTAATGSLAATTEALWMGYYDGTSHHLNGYLDDVSIYDTVLSDAEITNLSNNQMGRYEYHHTNALGSNIVLTDDNKNVLVRYEYDVFGAVRSEVDTTDNPRKFTGKEYESDVKLYYFAARYYDPYIGRFTQRDPAGDGINWYAYAANNPLKYVDPTGTRIVILGPTGIPEVTMDSNGVHNHTGDAGLSTEASVLYKGIVGEKDMTVTHRDGTTTTSENPDLRNTTAVGKTVMDVINSDKTVYLHFNASLPPSVAGDTDFVSATSDDTISIGINAANANNSFASYIIARKAIIHELVHANQAITDPNRFRNRDYSNVYGLEYQAYDIGARFAAEAGGLNATVLLYVPEIYLLSNQFNPNSSIYRYYISTAARASASRWR